MIATLCRHYPAYTPEAAAQAPAWVWRDLEILRAAGYFDGE